MTRLRRPASATNSATTPETSAGGGSGVPSLGQQAGLWQSRDSPARAVQLITQGLTYQQVADQMGYANKGTVHHLVGKTLAQTTAAAVQDLRQLEADRLDALQLGLWNKAMGGDTHAAMTIIRIIATRCRLFGLAPEASALPAPPRTVVVSAEEASR